MNEQLISLGVAWHAEAVAATAASRFAEAEAHARAAALALTAACGSTHPDVANAHLALATALERAGRFDEARHYAAEASAALESHAGLDNRDIDFLRVEALIVLGNLHRITGELSAAERTLGRALEVSRTRLGANDPQTAAAWNALGIVGKFTAQFDSAETAYLEALRIVVADPDAADLKATILHNLGGLSHERHRPHDGIDWAEQGLQLRLRLRGKDHPEVAADLGALGALYQQADLDELAEAAYVDALTIVERWLGSDHYEAGVLAGNLAMVRARQGRSDDAKSLYWRALRVKTAALGPEHPDIAVTLHNLGVFLIDAGDEDEAAQGYGLLEQADAILARHFAADHPRRIAVGATIAVWRHSPAAVRHARASATTATGDDA